LPEIDEYIIDLSAVEEPVELEIPEDESITLEIFDNLFLDTSNITISKVAGQIIGGHRVVVPSLYGRVIYADKDEASHANNIIGITKQAALENESVIIQTCGEMIEPTWNWTLSLPIFLGNTGLLTQIIPVNGFALIIGYPLTPTSIYIDIKQPIIIN
jgi:hypothetical protein